MTTSIIVCPHCGTKNRIQLEKKDQHPKCGRCHQPLPEELLNPVLTLRCSQCSAKNRVPLAKLADQPKCGRCKASLPTEHVTDGRPVLVSDGNFAQTVLQSPQPVLLYAWASWCSVCSGINSTVDQLAQETKGKLRVGKLNIEANPELANRYNILSVPAFFIFDAGQLKEHLPGAVPKYDLMMKMAAYI